jgi:hypothetical protein
LQNLALNAGNIIEKYFNVTPLFSITMHVVHFGVLCVYFPVGVERTEQQAGAEKNKLQGL